jgi:hypothetical protein
VPIQTNIWFVDPVEDNVSSTGLPSQVTSQQYGESNQNQSYLSSSSGLGQSQNYSLPQFLP